jgi:hypothetical protein
MLEILSHLLFIDDVILFSERTMRECQDLKEILELFCAAIGMHINLANFNMLVSEIWEDSLDQLDVILPYAWKIINDGIKYLGFELKPNVYYFEN